MLDPRSAIYSPIWHDLERFGSDLATDIAYGHRHEPRIVAVEHTGDNEVTEFRRSATGSTTATKRESVPWFVTSVPDRFTGQHDMAVRELRGTHPLRFLVECASWKAYRLSGQAELRPRGDVIGPRTLVSQHLMRTGTTLFNDMVYNDLRRMQLDIETRTLDPAADDAEILMVAVKQGIYEDVLVLESTEQDLLERLNRLVQKLDPDVIEGHNLIGFDIPYIVARARKLGVTLRFGRNHGAPRELDRANGRDTVYIFGRHVIDTLPQVQRFDVAGHLTRYGLKDVIRQLGLERENRVFVDRTTITEIWERGDRDTLREYALDDVRDVDVLSQLIMPNAFYQTQMLPSTYQGVTLSGTGKSIDDLLIRAYLHANHAVPKPSPSTAFPGGYVDVMRTGAFGPIVKCDVESLYPSIMIRESLSPQSDVLGAFPVLLKELTERRLDAKRKSRTGDPAERAMWNGLQGGFKILINSFYGYLGFGRGAFNDYPAARWVTLEGQRLIRHVVASLERRGALPIEVDTDGVYFVPPHHVTTEDAEQALIASVSHELGDGINLAHDGRFARMLSLKQKTYALLDYEGQMHMTGSALRSRALEPVFRTFLADAARHLCASDIAGAKTAYFDVAAALIAHELPIDDISQITRVRASRLGSRTRLHDLLTQHADRWQDGDRVAIYERDDGTLGFVDDYADDENVGVLLKRLRETAERFRPALDDAEFEAMFPLLTPTTNLDVARKREPIRQLGLL